MRPWKFHRVILTAWLICFAGAVGGQTNGSSNDRWIKTLLSAQGFSGELGGDVAFVNLGNLDCNHRELQVIFYEWTETKPPGASVHQSHRLIFLDAQRYVGSYSVDDGPTSVETKQIVFAYPKAMGNTLQCDSNGLPKMVLLDGYTQPLFK